MTLKHLTKDLTSYDLLKTFAVLLMLVDHTGYYFFEDDDWWRVFGRFCVPVWFFLIGYARSRDLGPKLWGGMAIVVGASFVTGMGVFPINILGSILVVRLVLDPVMERVLRVPQGLWQIGVMMILLSFPTSYLFEYGTLAVVLAMFGWLVRHQHEYPGGERQTQLFFVFAAATFIAVQSLYFSFAPQQIVVLAMGSVVVLAFLYFFSPITFHNTGQGFAGVLLAPIRFMGRHTLEIYVVHLVVFKMIAATTQPERFGWFAWRWLPEAATTVAALDVTSLTP